MKFSIKKNNIIFSVQKYRQICRSIFCIGSNALSGTCCNLYETAFFEVISDKGKYFEEINMTFKKNMKIVAIMALIFIVLKLIACGISAGISEIPNKEMINLIAAIVSLPISLILVVIFSFI